MISTMDMRMILRLLTVEDLERFYEKAGLAVVLSSGRIEGFARVSPLELIHENRD